MGQEKEFHFADFVDETGLETNLEKSDAAKAKRAKKENDAPKFPCESCAGTGIYRGVRLHQPESKCFSCNGRGFFRKSRQDRAAARQKAAIKKLNRIEEAKTIFRNQNPGVAEFLAANQWSDFFRSLLEQFNARGSLTENQVAAIQRSQVKMEANRAAREAEKDKLKTAVNLQPILDMFQKALSNNLRKPIYRAEGLVLSPASSTGKNPGAIYVKRADGEYVGKVAGGQDFHPVRSTTEADKAALLAIAANPLDAAVRYGRLTGNCGCCGRRLDRKDSIERGIGPICAEKWGLL